MSERIFSTFSDGEYAVIESLSDESKRTPETVELSQSKVVRLLCRHALNDLLNGEFDVIEGTNSDIDAEALNELIPDSARARYYRDEIKNDNWLVDMRGGFEGRVRREFRKRFKNGYEPETIAELAEGFAKEAQVYWQLVGDDTEAYQQKLEFIEARVQEYREKHDISDYDPNAEWLKLEGVERGAAAAEVDQQAEQFDMERLEAEATERLSSAPNADSDAIASAVAKDTGVPLSVAERATNAAVEAGEYEPEQSVQEYANELINEHGVTSIRTLRQRVMATFDVPKPEAVGVAAEAKRQHEQGDSAPQGQAATDGGRQ